ncbi:STAS domain-containing protein [Winogradskya consettensis]|uniref:Anti-sigma factor antagonist n=1 Tax=Winogradskya consettensis TaxID=113560 RepID=A0A919SWZ0_9ACTN|nr:anti-sigma factor antagonist [Actinoplanes consettensis]
MPLCNRVSVDQDFFSVTTSVAGDLVTAVVTGEVDMSTAHSMVEAVTGQDATAAVLDLRGVTFFDSAAIHALVRLAERYPDALRVLPSPQVHRVLDISGLSDQPWLTNG